MGLASGKVKRNYTKSWHIFQDKFLSNSMVWCCIMLNVLIFIDVVHVSFLHTFLATAGFAILKDERRIVSQFIEISYIQYRYLFHLKYYFQ